MKKLPSGWVCLTHVDRKGLKIEIESKEIILCKDCKYFEYDSFSEVAKVPIIVGHEICKKWGNGCKTNEDGWCYLAEPYKEEGAE